MQKDKSLIDLATMFKLSYGLFILTAKEGGKDNGCVINTVCQVTENPLRITMAVNKAMYTHDMVLHTGEFNISVLTEHAPFTLCQQFGYQSGKNVDKFDNAKDDFRTENGIRYIPEFANSVISAKVAQTWDLGTHTLFLGDVTQAFVLSKEPSATYQYYFDHIKPRPAAPKEQKKGFVCKVCGYIHEGDTLPEDFICPWCKHSALSFEPLEA